MAERVEVHADWGCHLCGIINCGSANSLSSHLAGKRHKKKLKENGMKEEKEATKEEEKAMKEAEEVIKPMIQQKKVTTMAAIAARKAANEAEEREAKAEAEKAKAWEALMEEEKAMKDSEESIKPRIQQKKITTMAAIAGGGRLLRRRRPRRLRRQRHGRSKGRSCNPTCGGRRLMSQCAVCGTLEPPPSPTRRLSRAPGGSTRRWPGTRTSIKSRCPTSC